jgi:hypothetical protein
VRQLLDQTSGLADREVHELNRRQPATLAEATISLNSARLVAAPGTQFNYHNPNYQVAARLVEVLSGETFENYLRTHVFGPAGMPASTTTNTDDQPVAGLADGHVIAYGQPVAISAPHTSGGRLRRRCQQCRRHGGLAHRPRQRRPSCRRRPRSLGAQPEGAAHSQRAERLRARLGHRRAGRRPDPAGAQRQPGHLQRLPGVLPSSSYGVALLFNSGSALLLDQTAIFYGLLNIVEGTDSTPSGPRFYISTLDVVLGCLTLAVLVLGILTSRRWASRHTTPSRVRTTAHSVNFQPLLTYPAHHDDTTTASWPKTYAHGAPWLDWFADLGVKEPSVQTRQPDRAAAIHAGLGGLTSREQSATHPHDGDSSVCKNLPELPFCTRSRCMGTIPQVFRRRFVRGRSRPTSASPVSRLEPATSAPDNHRKRLPGSSSSTTTCSSKLQAG